MELLEALSAQEFLAAEKYIQNPCVNVNLKSKQCQTALHLCVENKKYKLALLLLSRPDLSIYSINGDLKTVLHLAVCTKEQVEGEIQQVLERIVQLGSIGILNAQQKSGYTALHYAVEKGSESVLDWLLKKNANTNLKTKKGHTALHTAAYFDSFTMVKTLLRYGANVDIQDNLNMYCYELGSNEALKNLLWSFSEGAMKNIKANWIPAEQNPKMPWYNQFYELSEGSEFLDASKMAKMFLPMKEKKILRLMDLLLNATPCITVDHKKIENIDTRSFCMLAQHVLYANKEEKTKNITLTNRKMYDSIGEMIEQSSKKLAESLIRSQLKEDRVHALISLGNAYANTINSKENWDKVMKERTVRTLLCGYQAPPCAVPFSSIHWHHMILFMVGFSTIHNKVTNAKHGVTFTHHYDEQFARLRIHCGIHRKDFDNAFRIDIFLIRLLIFQELSTFGMDYDKQELCSSMDNRFQLRKISKEEFDSLGKCIEGYIEHIVENNSLLPRMLALYSLNHASIPTTYYLVELNTVPPHIEEKKKIQWNATKNEKIEGIGFSKKAQLLECIESDLCFLMENCFADFSIKLFFGIPHPSDALSLSMDTINRSSSFFIDEEEELFPQIHRKGLELSQSSEPSLCLFLQLQFRLSSNDSKSYARIYSRSTKSSVEQLNSKTDFLSFIHGSFN